MLKRFRFILIISCLAFFGKANAQFCDPQSLEVGAHVGTSYYIGDINPSKHFAQPDLQFGAVVRYNLNSRWTVRMDYAYATVKATDEVIKWRPERGLGFRTVIHDLGFVAEFNFLEYFTGNPKRNCSPYLFGGVSCFLYAPYSTTDSIGAALRPMNTEHLEKPYGLLAKTSPMALGISIPFGFGVKLSISKHVGMTLEWRLHKTFTDYLDDCGTVYPDEEYHAIGENGYDYTDPTGNYSAGMQRGNAAFKDWYGMARVSFTWKINLPDGRGCNLSKF